MERYKFIEEGQFTISMSTRDCLNQKYQERLESGRINIVIGVVLCVLSPVSIFAGDIFGDRGTVYGVCALLLIIAAAVNLLIMAGVGMEAYKKLLKLEEYSDASRKQDKIVGAVASVVWPLAGAAFLIAGFLYNAWSTAWIIFPIIGILFGAFAAVCNILTGNQK